MSIFNASVLGATLSFFVLVAFGLEPRLVARCALMGIAIGTIRSYLFY